MTYDQWLELRRWFEDNQIPYSVTLSYLSSDREIYSVSTSYIIEHPELSFSEV